MRKTTKKPPNTIKKIKSYRKKPILLSFYSSKSPLFTFSAFHLSLNNLFRISPNFASAAPANKNIMEQSFLCCWDFSCHFNQLNPFSLILELNSLHLLKQF